PLGYSSVNKGEIKLELLDQPENMIVILEDTELEIFHNLRMPYTFSTNHIEEADRFKLHMGSTNSNIYSYVGGNQLVFTQDGNLVFYDSKSLAGGKFSLLNIAGQELQKGKIEEGLELDVSNYPTGVYLLKANLRGEVKTQKLIIK
ncbi:MAG: T9SS type A sorting domain-containing protein, partial [Schleiferiaceae bacterium]|nr:T9SS type A sorting domain-containing protein [Schleiferiaceae bacterium]